MPIKRKCKKCNKEFYVKPSIVKKGRGVFCSKLCFYKWFSQNMRGKNHFRWKRIERKCPICNKIFYATPSRIKDNRGKFCSVECMGKWYSKHNKKENSPVWLGEVKRKCKTCGKEFLINISKVKKGEGIFCSKQCAGVYKTKHMKKKATKIENLIEHELIKNKISYDKQVPILVAYTVVDFLLPNKVVIYCDGDYWHKLPKVKRRDENQNFLLKSNGYKVFRFSETDIKKSATECIKRVEL